MLFKDLIETEEYKNIWNLMLKNSFNNKIPYKSKKTGNKTKQMSLGRIWFNLLLPENYKLIDETITKSHINIILTDILNTLGTEAATEAASNLQSGGFAVSSIMPSSFNIDSFIFPQKLKKEIENFQKNCKDLPEIEYTKEKSKLVDKIIDHLKNSDTNLYKDIQNKLSGKVTPDIIGLLFVSKGSTVDIQDQITRIPESLSDGYSVDNYYKAAGEGRRGFYIRSTAVSEPSYVARKLIYANAGTKLNSKNCKSNKYLELLINKDNINRLLSRYYLDENSNKLEIITKESKLIGKKIKIRSPLYCKDKDGLCHTCCGNLPSLLETKNIGFLAGGALNNEFVNNMMKQRHKASALSVKEVDFNEIIKNSPVDSININKYLNIEKNKIYTKVPLRMIIDESEFSEDMISINDEYVTIPGFLELLYGEGDDIITINLPLPFDVNIFKPDDYRKESHFIYMNFEEGDLILEKYQYLDNFNTRIVSRVLDGVLKFINDPIMLLDIIIRQTKTVDFVYLETIIANMFRSKEDSTIPGRLVDYKNCTIIGSKRLPFIDSWLSGLAFEDFNYAISNALLKSDKQHKWNPLEMLIREEFSEE
jgi:hypothetical protein